MANWLVPPKPGRWALQPGAADPSWRWAWRGLILALPMWDGGAGAFDYAARRLGAFGGANSRFTPAQPGMAFDSEASPSGGTSTSYISFGTGVNPFAGRTKLSALILVRPRTYTNNTCSIIRKDGSHNLQLSSANEFDVALWRGGSLGILSTSLTGLGKTAATDWLTFGFTWDGGPIRSFIDGQFRATGSTASSAISTSSNDFRIAATEGGGEAFSGLTGVVLYWDRAVTDEEHRRLAADPFGPFRAAAIQKAPVVPRSLLVGRQPGRGLILRPTRRRR